jgi:TfdA family taurine catabolism dioxygenase TauD
LMDALEQAFVAQSAEYLDLLKALIPSHTESCDLLGRHPRALVATVVGDPHRLTPSEILSISRSYYGEDGVAVFVVLGDTERTRGHPLLHLASQLCDTLPCSNPLEHPLERHPDTLTEFGMSDGTLKIRSVRKDPRVGYVEQGETNEEFLAHNDGLGSGNTVETSMLYMETPPLDGGYTYFANVMHLALHLAEQDLPAFQHLFLPDAISVVRRRGKGAIRIVAPVLYLDHMSRPAMFLRVASGEYDVAWRPTPELARARAFLEVASVPFAVGSSFAHFFRPGHGCIIRNQHVVHGRTAFVDGAPPSRRVLSRKWFMSTPQDAIYKHVPALRLRADLASLYPERFGAAMLEGEWLLDSGTMKNVRVR